MEDTKRKALRPTELTSLIQIIQSCIHRETLSRVHATKMKARSKQTWRGRRFVCSWTLRSELRRPTYTLGRTDPVAGECGAAGRRNTVPQRVTATTSCSSATHGSFMGSLVLNKPSNYCYLNFLLSVPSFGRSLAQTVKPPRHKLALVTGVFRQPVCRLTVLLRASLPVPPTFCQVCSSGASCLGAGPGPMHSRIARSSWLSLRPRFIHHPAPALYRCQYGLHQLCPYTVGGGGHPIHSGLSTTTGHCSRPEQCISATTTSRHSGIPAPLGFSL